MGTDLILAPVFLVAATFMLPAYSALESEPATPDSESFSECLGDPIRGLVYRFQRPAKGLNYVKIGCYAKFGNGSTQFKNPPDRLKVLQYFVTDVTGTTMLRSRSDYANVVISSHNQVSIRELELNTSNSRRIKFDQACFPKNCYTCVDDWRQTCHSPDSENPTFRAYEVDTSLYCDRRGDNDLVPFLEEKRPRQVDCMLKFLNVSEIAKPFLVLDYEAVSQGVLFGCKIYKPIHSVTAFREFYLWNGGFQQVNVSSIISLRREDLPSLRLPPQDVSFQDFCFPPECYTSNENAPCGTILGKPYKETRNYISLNGENTLMSNTPSCM